MKIYYDSSGYYSLFDPITGVSVRGEVDGKDPFWKKDGPELLDVSITNYCEKQCSFCYRQSNPEGKHIELDLYTKIVNEAKKIGVFQIALGGGNPNQHPSFCDILRITRENGIVPSYTTNGQGMTSRVYQATKKYAGAVAVSWYKPYEVPRKVIDQCAEYGIPINIHFILSDDTIDEAIALLEERCLDEVNAIVFLNYKPVGAMKKAVLHSSDRLSVLLEKVLTFSSCKIGFDSCMISYLMPFLSLIHEDSIDYCEAGRFSAFISENGEMFPCSFMSGNKDMGISILDNRISDVWQNGQPFLEYRRRLEKRPKRCSGCEDFVVCHGGCRAFNINCN